MLIVVCIFVYINFTSKILEKKNNTFYHYTIPHHHRKWSTERTLQKKKCKKKNCFKMFFQNIFYAFSKYIWCKRKTHSEKHYICFEKFIPKVPFNKFIPRCISYISEVLFKKYHFKFFFLKFYFGNIVS